MKKQIFGSFAALVAATVAVSQFAGTTHAERGASDRATGGATDLGDVVAPANDDVAFGGSGADVIVGSLPNSQYFGQSGSIKAYSIATTSCNEGNVNLNWFQGGLNHPVIAQNIYRYQVLGNGVGRFEQIGMSWLKHGFCALQGTVCGACSPVCGGCCAQLGPGCSDPYSSGLNGNWSDLGPRSEVNATTGDYLWPHAFASGSTTTRGRIQIEASDLVVGAQYFLEGQYVALDDATAGNGLNNASWREANLSGNNLNATGATNRKQPAIRAWVVEQGPSVSMQTVTFNSGAGDPDERFHVAWSVTDLGNGTWNYEYAVHNLNSDRAADSWFIPVPDGVNVTNIGGHYINHHSGEPYDTSAWTWTQNAQGIQWSAPFAGANTNALRWGTMFNFRFDADTPPIDVDGELGLFKAGTPGELTIGVEGPDGPMDDPCLGDTNGDNMIDIDDVVNIVLCFGTDGIDCPNPGDNTNTDGIGVVDIDDVVLTVLQFGMPCP